MGVADAAEEPGGSERVPRQRAGEGGDTAGSPRAGGPADAELLRRMREGDAAAYEELYRRHAGAVRRYARTCCRDADTADDLTNEVFAATLQAVRGGAGPRSAVRAYLLTAVRRVAAGWARTARREELVEDFAAFVEFAECTAAAGGARDGAGAVARAVAGADVDAMRRAEAGLAVRAFRSLPERWQAVLWHTAVERASPREVAPLLGLTPNATAVLAHRAREGLRQAYLQAHVSLALTRSGECAPFADQLGAYARGGLRARAMRGLRKHLAECARCATAASEVRDLNDHIRAVLPVAVVGWFAAQSAAKGAAFFGRVQAGAAAAGSGAGAVSAGAGAARSGSGSGSVGGGLGAPAKAGIIAGVSAVAGIASLVLALLGGDGEAEPAKAGPSVEPSEPASVPQPQPTRSRTTMPEPTGEPEPEREPTPEPEPDPTMTPTPAPTPTPTPTQEPTSAPGSRTEPGAEPTPEPTPEPVPPGLFQVRKLAFDLNGDDASPAIVLADSSPVWQREGLLIAGEQYAHGVTVQGETSVTIDLNRPCDSYRAMVGIDDLSRGVGAVEFAVFGDGRRLWRSGVVAAGEPAVAASVALAGVESLRLSTTPDVDTPASRAALAAWAEAEIHCG